MKRLAKPYGLSLFFITLVILGGIVFDSPVASNDFFYPDDSQALDMVVDASRNRFYASDYVYNYIYAFDLDTMQVLDRLYVGVNPGHLDISADGSQLAIAVSGSGKIVFIDLDTFTIADELTPTTVIGKPNEPWDVKYGHNDLLYSTGTDDYVHIFDLASRTEITHTAETFGSNAHLAISGDKNTLLVQDSDTLIYKYDISGTEPVSVTYKASSPFHRGEGLGLCLLPDGRVVNTTGEIWSDDLVSLDVTLPIQDAVSVLCHPMEPKVYFSTEADGLVVFEIGNNRPAATYLPDSATSATALAKNDTQLIVSVPGSMNSLGTAFATRIYLPAQHSRYCSPYYMDDFERDMTYWPVISSSNVESRLLAGEYSIYTKNDGYFYTFLAPACEHRYYAVETDVRWTHDMGSSYGLVFGVEGNFDYYYLFDMSSEYQAYRLFYFTPITYEAIVMPTQSGAIYKDTAVNHIVVKYYDQKIRIFVNGTEIISKSVPAYMNLTRTGVLSMPSNGTPISDVRFDNFQIVALDDSGTPVTGSINVILQMASSDDLPDALFDFDWEMLPRFDVEVTND